MNFPIIRNIYQLTSPLEGRPEFVIAKKEGYTAIDYNYVLDDTFDDPMRLECRGIKFDNKTGDILARPFQKFFNLGEKGTTFNPQTPHLVTFKDDGSMVHTIVLNGELRLMTRMGLTDQAKAAERLLTPYQKAELLAGHTRGNTFIFEYVGPENRIVLKYDKPELILLAVRKTVTGEYHPRLFVESAAMWLGVKVVSVYSPPSGGTVNPGEIAALVKKHEGIEGVVVQYINTGHMLKIKSEDYVLKHRAVSECLREHNFVRLVVENKHDDVIALLPNDKQKEFEEYAVALNKEISRLGSFIGLAVSSLSHMDQKEFALHIQKQYDQRVVTLLFRARQGALEKEVVREWLLKKTNNSKNWAEARGILDLPDWKGFDL